MTIVLFLIDTSASMNQKTYLGTSLLDLGKGAVETFIKQRGRDPATRGLDRYMLLTFEDPPRNIKAGWKETQTEFSHQLKNLRAEGLTSFGPALGNALHYLNLNRLSSGMDFYGLGRYPFHLEPALILAITDGGCLTSGQGVVNELTVPVNNTIPGSELTKEPFRWDQRVFSLVLRVPGHHPDPNLNPPGAVIGPDFSPIEGMCEVTGGRSFSVTSHKALLQCIEALVQKVQKGAVCMFEKFGPDPPPMSLQEDANSNLAKLENGYLHDAKTRKLEEIILNNHIPADSDTPVIPDSDKKPEWHETKRMIFVPRSFIRGYAGHWPIPESYWPDLNSSQLPSRDAQPLMKFKCEPCEPTVFNEFPFDKYELEPSPLSQFILERRQPTVCWQVFVQNSGRFEGLGLPFGYLKAATNLSCVNLFIMPYNYPVLIPLLHLDLVNISAETVTALKKDLQEFGDLKLFLRPVSGLGGAPLIQNKGSAMFQNPFDIPRAHLMNQLAKMRLNLKQQLAGKGIPVLPGGLPGEQLRLQQAEDLHNMMIGQMGNFEPYKQRYDRHRLRPLEEPTKRVHAFGNPYKVDKKMQIDEIGEFEASVGGSGIPGSKPGLKRNLSTGSEGSGFRGNKPPKRHAGPLPRNFRYKKRRRTRKDSTGSVIYVGGTDDETGSIFSDTESVVSNSEDLSIGELSIDLKEEENREETAEDRLAAGKAPSELENEVKAGSSSEPSPVDSKLPEPPKQISLPSKEIDKRKRDISSSVRTPGKGCTKSVPCMIPQDLVFAQEKCLLQHALLEATRFKRKELMKQLNLRLSKLNSSTQS